MFNKTTRNVFLTLTLTLMMTAAISFQSIVSASSPSMGRVSAKVSQRIVIVSVANIKTEVYQNDKYALPKTVTAIMSDRSEGNVAVKWNRLTASTKRVGTFNYTGTVNGYKGKINLTLTVKAAPANAPAGLDITAPAFNGVSVDKNVVELSDTVNVTVDAADDISGIHSISVGYKSYSGETKTAYLNLGSDGKYTGSISLNNNLDESGTWQIDYINIDDNSGNSKMVNPIDIDLSAGNVELMPPPFM